MAAVAVQNRPAMAPLQMQGVAVPAGIVDVNAFRERTRRHIQQEKALTYSGQSGDIVELRKSDILAGITVRFSGTVTITPGTGTVASTARWPYDFIKAARFTANGASNLINTSGLKLKLRDIQKHGDLTDRGVQQTIGGVVRNQGTLAKATEVWGVGSNTYALANGSYSVDLEWHVPVAEDMIDLAGAIFLQTSTADLTLALDYAPLTDLFVTTGNGTVALTGGFQVLTTKFSIPVVEGGIVVPDLSAFHSMIQSRVANGLATGENELRLVGQGSGKALIRLSYQLWNGAGTASAPVPMTAANFGVQSWRYATNETPDQFIDGTHMRIAQERFYNSDVGGYWGFGTHEFSREDSWRDVVDLGTTAEFRLVTNLQTALTLASPALEYVMETAYVAGQGA
jgi:hypothetical protein